MAEPTAHLEIRRDGRAVAERVLDLDTISVGRATASYQPDVALDDADSLISRRHCVFTQRFGSWWVEDCGSRNGTHLLRGGERRPVDGETQLADDDIVCIVAAADADGPTSWWEIVVRDPSATAALLTGPRPVSTTAEASPTAEPMLLVDVVSRRVLLFDGAAEREVELRRQGLDLVIHMARRNAEVAAPPAVCTTEELLEAVWGPASEWDRYRPPTGDNLRDVVLAVRRAVEPDPKKPRFLLNQRGVGYRLASTTPSRN